MPASRPSAPTQSAPASRVADSAESALHTHASSDMTATKTGVPPASVSPADEPAASQTPRLPVVRIPPLSHLRFLLLMMLGAYLLINAILYLLAPLTEGWPVWLTTLVAVPFMVLGMVHVIAPFAAPKKPRAHPVPEHASKPPSTR
ncbi:MAG: hypothetical protein AB7E29_04575 [Xanthobacter sp.]